MPHRKFIVAALAAFTALASAGTAAAANPEPRVVTCDAFKSGGCSWLMLDCYGVNGLLVNDRVGNLACYYTPDTRSTRP